MGTSIHALKRGLFLGALLLGMPAAHGNTIGIATADFTLTGQNLAPMSIYGLNGYAGNEWSFRYGNGPSPMQIQSDPGSGQGQASGVVTQNTDGTSTWQLAANSAINLPADPRHDPHGDARSAGMVGVIYIPSDFTLNYSFDLSASLIGIPPGYLSQARAKCDFVIEYDDPSTGTYSTFYRLENSVGRVLGDGQTDPQEYSQGDTELFLPGGHDYEFFFSIETHVDADPLPPVPEGVSCGLLLSVSCLFLVGYGCSPTRPRQASCK